MLDTCAFCQFTRFAFRKLPKMKGCQNSNLLHFDFHWIIRYGQTYLVVMDMKDSQSTQDDVMTKVDKKARKGGTASNKK